MRNGKDMAKPPLEPGIYLDLEGSTTYGDYLSLETILHAQHRLSSPPQHDEMLFIIAHQTSELWMKLMIHELTAALGFIRSDQMKPCFKVLSRVGHVQRILFEQWSVLETL